MATTWLSISITIVILAFSIKRFSGARFNSLYFFLTLLVSVLISWVLSPVALLIAIFLEADLVKGLDPQSLALLMTIVTNEHVYGTSQIADLYFVLNVTLLRLRMLLAVAFTIWVMAGWLLVWTKVTIYRLFEADKGALSVLATTITVMAAAIKWASTP